MSYYRCSKCRARNSLGKPPHEYVRPQKCQGCGRKMHPFPPRRTVPHFTLDRYRMTKERGRHAKKCRGLIDGCGGYSFPHRWGGGFCYHNPRLTEDMMREREERGRWA